MTTTTEQVVLKAGDEVRVYDGRTKGGESATVVKVGRKLVTVNGPGTYSRDEMFRLDDQTFNGTQYGYGRWFRTMEQVAQDERRAEAMKYITNAGIQLTYRSTPFTVDQLEELAALVQSWNPMSAYGGGTVHRLCEDGPTCTDPKHLEVKPAEGERCYSVTGTAWTGPMYCGNPAKTLDPNGRPVCGVHKKGNPGIMWYGDRYRYPEGTGDGLLLRGWKFAHGDKRNA